MSQKCILTALPVLFFMTAAQAELQLSPLNSFELDSLPAFAQVSAEVKADANAALWWWRGSQASQLAEFTLVHPATGTDLAFEQIELGHPRNCYALLVDNSKSMDQFWPQAKEAITQVIALVPDNDALSLAVFAEDLAPLQPITAAQASIEAIQLTGVDTQLYLALIKASDTVAHCPAPGRHLVLFSDGDAEDKARTLAEALTVAHKHQISIHAVGFGTEGRAGTAIKMEILRTLTEQTQGLYHFYQQPDALAAVFRSLFTAHQQMAIIRPIQIASLPFGTRELTLLAELQDAQGQAQTQTLVLPLTGTDQWSNLLVTIEAKSGLDARWVLAAPVVLLVLLSVALLLRRRVRLARQAKDAAVHQADLQAEQERRDQALQQAIDAVGHKVEQFAPHEPVMDQAKPYGWLVSKTKTYDLIVYSTRIGRAPDNDVVIDDLHISGEHAILDFKRGRFIWTDRAPMNPTEINDEQVQGSRELAPNDVIRCGKTELRFVLELVE